MSDLSGTPTLQPARPPAARKPAHYMPGRRNADRALESARRHSGFVRSLRYILPALVLIGIGAFWFTARFVPAELPAGLGAASIDVGTRTVTMKSPHLSGFEGTRRAYQMDADTAVQSLDHPRLITLNNMIMHFALSGGEDATVHAVTGLYNSGTSELTLSDGVIATTTSGDKATLDGAWVDIETGKVIAQTPVVLTSGDRVIHANAMTVFDGGQHVAFSRGVTVTYSQGVAITPAATTNGATAEP